MNVKDAASELRVSTRRVYEMIKSGSLSAEKEENGKDWRIAEDSVDEIKQRQKNRANFIQVGGGYA